MTGHRRAVILLGEQHIARMLALPEGMRVLAARDDFMRNGIAVLVEGDMLEEQPEHCVLPDVPVAMLDRTELAMRAEVRAVWSPDGAELQVWCSVLPCRWSASASLGDAAYLAQLADIVKRHLDEAHAS